MSLQIWLPFTKDDSNYGILDSKPFYNSGKKVNSDHGGGYEFNNAEKQCIRYEHKPEINNFKSFSLSCWAKSNTAKKNGILSLTYSAVILNTGIRFGNIDGQNTIASDKLDMLWHNYILEFDYNTQIAYFYIDGKLINQYKYNDSNGKFKFKYNNGLFVGVDCNDTSINSFHFNGIITDVRVYNHCLSPLEIKQLSVGLIGHYPLNDEYITSTKNLCKSNTWNETTNHTWGNTIYTSKIIDIQNNPSSSKIGNKITCVTKDATKNGGWSLINNSNVLVNAGDTYIYSLYIKSTIPINEIDHNLLYIYFYNQELGLITERGYKNNIIDCGNGWYRCWGKVVIPEKCQFVHLYSYDYPQQAGTYTYYLCAPQFEKSSELTPYTPSVREGSKYCYDISGLTNNIPLSEDINPLFVSDTARYSGSYNFNEVGQTIGTREHIKPTKNVSISAWVKSSKIDTVTEPNVDVDGINIYVNNSGIIHLVGTFGDLNSGVSCIDKWTHACGTYDGTTVKLYVNGVLKSSKSYSSDLKYVKGAAISSDSKSGITCKVSDFRIFSTALKDDYITDLYNMGTAVSSGTLATYELNE